MKPTLTVPLEIKALDEREFEGHGSVFGNVDLGGDIVERGAFKRTLEAHRKSGQLPQMFWMHDPSRVPGKWLEMREDSRGLFVKGTLADTELGNEIRTLLKMDAVRGLSIGYVTKDWDEDDDGNRLIKEVDLWEVSVVSLPMNPKAQVAHAKSRLSAIGEYVPTARELEQKFRDWGCSKRVARSLVASICAGETPADDDGETGATLEPPKDEAGVTLAKSNDSELSEEAQAIAALNAIAEGIYAQKIARAAACGFR